MSNLATTVFAAAALLSGVAAAQQATPTIVLVHGAFADASSWTGVITHLQRGGYEAIAVANPLRSVSSDARFVSDVVGSIEGPVVLVGHSYGGQVISNAVGGRDNVKSLVYVAAFAPDTGKAASDLAGNPREVLSVKRPLLQLSFLKGASIFILTRPNSKNNLRTTFPPKPPH